MQDNEELELGSWLISQLILDNEELEVGRWVVSWLVGLTTDTLLLLLWVRHFLDVSPSASPKGAELVRC
jgi:hypothetical protein